MKRLSLSAVLAGIILAALLAAVFPLPALAQTVTGATGGATLVLVDGQLHEAGSVLGEAEMQYQDERGRLRGGLLAYLGLSSGGGGEQVGGGYRRYFARQGSTYVFLGLGGFVLGEDTPGISELTAFGGGEIGLQLQIGDDPTDKATGFIGIWPGIVGQKDTGVIRGGVRLALN